MAFWNKKKKELKPVQTAALADAAEINDASALGYKYLQDFLAEEKAGENEKAMRSLIKSLYCSMTYEDNAFRFDPTDRIQDEEMVAPFHKQFLEKNKDLFDDSMIDDCLTVSVSNPPALERVKAIIYPYVRG